jgi:hypothetical protein
VLKLNNENQKIFKRVGSKNQPEGRKFLKLPSKAVTNEQNCGIIERSNPRECRIKRREQMPPKIEVSKIDVNPKHIAIFEVEKTAIRSGFYIIYPKYYKCQILLSPWVVQRLLQWLLNQGYIQVYGKLVIKIRGKRSVYNGESETKDNAP